MHVRQACYYYLLGVLCIICSVIGSGISRIMFYPAFTCILVGSIYLADKPGWFCKIGGRHSLFSILLFGPYLTGSWCSWFYYRKKLPPCSEILPGILLGRRLNHAEAQRIINNSEVAVLDLAPEIAEVNIFCNQNYRHIPVLDLTPPSTRQLAEAVKFINRHHPDSKIFIHCALGLSRGAAVVAAYLVRKGLNTDKTVSLIRRSRPQVIVQKEIINLLNILESKPESEDPGEICCQQTQP